MEKIKLYNPDALPTTSHGFTSEEWEKIMYPHGISKKSIEGYWVNINTLAIPDIKEKDRSRFYKTYRNAKKAFDKVCNSFLSVSKLEKRIENQDFERFVSVRKDGTTTTLATLHTSFNYW